MLAVDFAPGPAGVPLVGAFAGVAPLGVRVVRAISAPRRSPPRAPQAVVAAHPLLVLGCDLLVVVEAGAVFDPVFGRGDFDDVAILAHRDYVHGDQGRLGTQKAHLHADVLGIVALVHEQVVDLADLLTVAVVDLVARVPLLELREAIATLFSQNAHL